MPASTGVPASTTTSTATLRTSLVLASAIMCRFACMPLPVARLVRLEVVERAIAAVGGRPGVSVARVVAVVNLTVEAATAVKPPTTSGSVPRHFSTEKGVPNSHPAG